MLPAMKRLPAGSVASDLNDVRFFGERNSATVRQAPEALLRRMARPVVPGNCSPTANRCPSASASIPLASAILRSSVVDQEPGLPVELLRTIQWPQLTPAT